VRKYGKHFQKFPIRPVTVAEHVSAGYAQYGMSAKRAELLYFLMAGVCLGLAALLAMALQRAGLNSRQAGMAALAAALVVCGFVIPRIVQYTYRRSRKRLTATSTVESSPVSSPESS
jgi:hypothetical protein